MIYWHNHLGTEYDTVAFIIPTNTIGTSPKVYLTNHNNGNKDSSFTFRYDTLISYGSNTPAFSSFSGTTRDTLRGSGLTKRTSSVYVGGVSKTIYLQSDTTVIYAAGSGTQGTYSTVVYVNADSQVLSLPNQILWSTKPTLYCVNPDTALGGDSVKINWAGMFATQGSGYVELAGVPITSFSSWTVDTGRCIVPNGLGWKDLIATNSQGEKDTLPNAIYLTGQVLQPYTVVPAYGTCAGGTYTTLSTTGSWFSNTAFVKFDGRSATSITVIDKNHIRCKTPVGLVDSKKNVFVQSGTGDTLTLVNGYRYIIPPCR